MVDYVGGKEFSHYFTHPMGQQEVYTHTKKKNWERKECCAVKWKEQPVVCKKQQHKTVVILAIKTSVSCRVCHKEM